MLGSHAKGALAGTALLLSALAAPQPCVAGAPVPPAEPERISRERLVFPAAESGITLTGWLWKLQGAQVPPSGRAGVILLHGCSGLVVGGGLRAHSAAWATRLVHEGYVVLMVDSAGPRAIASSCGRRADRRRLLRERPGDAYAALAVLAARSEVSADRIGLIGWSQGGAVAMLTVVDPGIGRPTPPPRHDFAAAVAFDPGACIERLHHAPYTTVAPGSWRTVAPVLVLMGAADNWTPATPCVAFLRTLAARGEPVRWHVYPGAVHGFDAPGVPRGRRSGPRLADGRTPLVGTDPEARADAERRVLAFLAAHLER